ncbi:serine--pyruvate aminotransferase [Arthrobacter sp. Hiyo8]|nr:serine--pyruvate aminotransferase [Arthrobacter sp. Hiyo8]
MRGASDGVGTRNARTLPLSATGSGGMEAAFVNTVSDGDVAVIAVNGLFGERMCEVARRCGATVVRVDHEWANRWMRSGSSPRTPIPR